MPLPFFHDRPCPVWVWVDYPNGLPRYIALNLQLIRKHAPPPHFVVHVVNSSSVRAHLPDLLPEFWRLSHRSAPSDAARMALVARHGGLYLDADFLVARPLLSVLGELQAADMVVYDISQAYAQRACRQAGEGASTNFFAARPNSSALTEAWATLEQHLQRPCPLGRRGKRFVCCPPPPAFCRTPWALTDAYLQPTIKRAVAARRLRLHCLPSFTPGAAPARAHGLSLSSSDQERLRSFNKAIIGFFLPEREFGCREHWLGQKLKLEKQGELPLRASNLTFTICCERHAEDLRCWLPGLASLERVGAAPPTSWVRGFFTRHGTPLCVGLEPQTGRDPRQEQSIA